MDIYIYAQLEESFGIVGLASKIIAVRDIIKESGQYSGLTLRVKELISPFTDNWKKCHLKLRRSVKPGWFTIENIVDTYSSRPRVVSHHPTSSLSYLFFSEKKKKKIFDFSKHFLYITMASRFGIYSRK